MISIVNDVIGINVPNNEKAFIAIGTSAIRNWAVDGTQTFVLPLSDNVDEFDKYGFDKDDYAKCQALEVGQSTDDFAFEGISVMRVQ